MDGWVSNVFVEECRFSFGKGCAAAFSAWCVLADTEGVGAEIISPSSSSSSSPLFHHCDSLLNLLTVRIRMGSSQMSFTTSLNPISPWWAANPGWRLDPRNGPSSWSECRIDYLPVATFPSETKQVSEESVNFCEHPSTCPEERFRDEDGGDVRRKFRANKIIFKLQERKFCDKIF